VCFALSLIVIVWAGGYTSGVVGVLSRSGFGSLSMAWVRIGYEVPQIGVCVRWVGVGGVRFVGRSTDLDSEHVGGFTFGDRPSAKSNQDKGPQHEIEGIHLDLQWTSQWFLARQLL
jgi:hypothetical protein